MLSVECSMLNVGRAGWLFIQHSTFNIEHSTFGFLPADPPTINSAAMDQATINTDIASAHELIGKLRVEVGRAVIGQEAIVDRLVIALLIRGHVLLEGVPGLAKTLLVKTLAGAIDASFHRIQFTPDL